MYCKYTVSNKTHTTHIPHSYTHAYYAQNIWNISRDTHTIELYTLHYTHIDTYITLHIQHIPRHIIHKEHIFRYPWYYIQSLHTYKFIRTHKEQTLRYIYTVLYTHIYISTLDTHRFIYGMIYKTANHIHFAHIHKTQNPQYNIEFVHLTTYSTQHYIHTCQHTCTSHIPMHIYISLYIHYTQHSPECIRKLTTHRYTCTHTHTHTHSHTHHNDVPRIYTLLSSYLFVCLLSRAWGPTHFSTQSSVYFHDVFSAVRKIEYKTTSFICLQSQWEKSIISQKQSVSLDKNAQRSHNVWGHL